MADKITAWKTTNGELFEIEQDAIDYEEYLTYKEDNFSELLSEINEYFYNYGIKHPITKEVVKAIGINSDSQFVNKLIISPDFINCNNFTQPRANSLKNKANGYKVYNLLIPYWALKQQV